MSRAAGRSRAPRRDPRASCTVSNGTPGQHEESRRDATDPSRRRRLLAALALLAAGVLVLDQGTKIAALAYLTPQEYVPLLGDLFGLQLVFNPGAAFSFASGATWIFTIAAVVVTIVIIRISRRLGSRAWALSLGALLGGNLGNLIDRLLRDPGFPQGHVVDFLNYGGLFIGNVADIAIVVAAIAIAVLAFMGIGVDGQRIVDTTKEDRDGTHVAETSDEGPDGSDSDTGPDTGPAAGDPVASAAPESAENDLGDHIDALDDAGSEVGGRES